MTAQAGPEPIRTHRGRFIANRPLRTVLSGLAVVATLAAGRYLSGLVPGTEQREQPFVRTGGMGQPVDGGRFTVTGLGVRGAAKISEHGTEHDSGGVWVVVTVRVDAKTEPVNIGYAVLRDPAGHTYRASQRISQALLGARMVQPGLPVRGVLVFEMPPAAVPGTVLRVADNSVDQRMDAMAEIRLAIGADAAQHWRADSQPLVLTAPQAATP